MPWQQLWVDVSMEIDDHGLFIYGEDVLSIGRQEGKTGGYRARSSWRNVVASRVLGPQVSLYIAQRRQDARKRLERDFAVALRAGDGFPEVEHPRQKPKGWTEWRLQLNNGAENIEFGCGSRWTIDAPSRQGVHGDTVDDAAIDEAWAQEPDIETGITPTMATRTNAQLHVFSAAGDASSRYWYSKILAGREACVSGQHGTVAYFEWSAPDDADPADPATWLAACPALGYTISLRFLENEWDRALRRGEEGIAEFRRNYLNQWPEVPVLGDDPNAEILIPDTPWDECENAGAKMVDPITLSIDVAPDSSAGAIGSAGDAGKRPLVEVVDYRPGTTWIVPRVIELRQRWGDVDVILDPAGPSGSLISDLEAAGIEPVLIKLREHAHACGTYRNRVRENGLWHLGQPVLNAARAGATKRTVGDVWLFDRRSSSIDICPLVATDLALWGHLRMTPTEQDADYFEI